MKVIAIVLGSVAGLVVLSVVALAIMIPIVSKNLVANSNDPKLRHAALAKIADFTVPSGLRVETALDLGISQTAKIVPIDKSKYSLELSLTGQHFNTTDDKTLLDRISAGAKIGSKLGGCDLKAAPDDIVKVNGKPVALRKFSCDGGDNDVALEFGIIHAKASTVQISASYVDKPRDRVALDALVRSIK